jgi:hypothetical protein
MVETIEQFFGGEAKLGTSLGVKTQVKTLKRLANDNQHDERHAPAIPGSGSPLSATDRETAMSLGQQILRAYEAYLLQQPGAATNS